ncbi:MAG TPA: serpin family protein [Gemmataceae bacterium]|nr:serpin family protein [Gemmataceae bacterium]
MKSHFLAFFVCLGIASIGLAGCKPPPDEPTLPNPVVTPDTQKAVEGNTEFAFDLFLYLGKQPGNEFFSPFSISTALAMTYGGARGETAEQMAKTLHFNLPLDRLHPAMGNLIVKTPGGKNPPYQLHVVNALWAQKGYPFLPDFLKLTRTNYGAEVQEVDFANATEEARRTINSWVEKQTEEKIRDLLQQGVLDSLTRLVLTNAIYFKGAWVSKFDITATKSQPFFVTAKESKNVSLMHQSHEFKYLRTNEFRILEMPYAGNEIAMVIILPEKVDGLPSVEQSFTPAKLKQSIAELKAKRIQVYVPRFQITQSVMLKKALADLGMPLAFSPDDADLTGMNGGKPAKLHISQVVHKAFVDVNEEGTEAAAATGVVVGEKSIAPPEEVFRADHAFIFLIRDIRTGSILFMGRIADPSAK